MEKELAECQNCPELYDGQKCRYLVRKKSCAASQKGLVTTLGISGPVIPIREPTADDIEAQSFAPVDASGYVKRHTCGRGFTALSPEHQSHFRAMQKMDAASSNPPVPKKKSGDSGSFVAALVTAFISYFRPDADVFTPRNPETSYQAGGIMSEQQLNQTSLNTEGEPSPPEQLKLLLPDEHGLDGTPSLQSTVVQVPVSNHSNLDPYDPNNGFQQGLGFGDG